MTTSFYSRIHNLLAMLLILSLTMTIVLISAGWRTSSSATDSHPSVTLPSPTFTPGSTQMQTLPPNPCASTPCIGMWGISPNDVGHENILPGDVFGVIEGIRFLRSTTYLVTVFSIQAHRTARYAVTTDAYGTFTVLPDVTAATAFGITAKPVLGHTYLFDVTVTARKTGQSYQRTFSWG